MGTPAYGPMPFAAPGGKAQIVSLQSQAEQMRDMLEQIEQQIRELEEKE